MKSFLKQDLFLGRMVTREPTSKFIRLRCAKCKNEQIVFGKSATHVNCLICNEPLIEASGGKSKVVGRILEVLE